MYITEWKKRKDWHLFLRGHKAGQKVLFLKTLIYVYVWKIFI